MAASVTGFALHAMVLLDPKNVDFFFEQFWPVYDKVVAEPECTLFEVYQSPNNTGELRWVEHWAESTEWFWKNQMTKDYYIPYLEATEPLISRERLYLTTEFPTTHMLIHRGYEYQPLRGRWMGKL